MHVLDSTQESAQDMMNVGTSWWCCKSDLRLVVHQSLIQLYHAGMQVGCISCSDVLGHALLLCRAQ